MKKEEIHALISLRYVEIYSTHFIVYLFMLITSISILIVK